MRVRASVRVCASSVYVGEGGGTNEFLHPALRDLCGWEHKRIGGR